MTSAEPLTPLPMHPSNLQTIVVSVIVPVFNCADMLASALTSIAEQEGSEAVEIIVVDDGSTDGSADVARGFGDFFPRITVVEQPNQGPSTARNRGLVLAQGALVSFLDADDLWPAGRLGHHLDLLARYPAADLVIGPTRVVRLDPESLTSGTPILPVPLIQHSLAAATYRRGLFARVGMFKPELTHGEDLEWFQRALQENVAIRMTRQVALEARLRPGSLSYGMVNHQQWFLKALRTEMNFRKEAEKQR